jgi:hypothetical protein
MRWSGGRTASSPPSTWRWCRIWTAPASCTASSTRSAFTGIAGAVTTVAEQLPTPPDADEDAPRWQSKGHRQALALHHLVTRDGDGPGTSAQVLVTVEQPDAGARRSRCTTGGAGGRCPRRRCGGWPPRPNCASSSPGGVPLKVGRTRRVATRAQRAAAAVLYGGCAWPGCPAPMSVCELHHVIPWQPPWYGDGRRQSRPALPRAPPCRHPRQVAARAEPGPVGDRVARPTETHLAPTGPRPGPATPRPGPVPALLTSHPHRRRQRDTPPGVTSRCPGSCVPPRCRRRSRSTR